MRTLLKMAFRNLFRHKRRTLLTFLVVAFGAATYVFYSCLLDGLSTQSFETMISLESAHIRIAHIDEDKDPLSLSNSIPHARIPDIQQTLSKHPTILSHTKRIHFTGEIDNGRDTTPCKITGLDPATDKRVFTLHKLAPLDKLKDNRALIGADLAKDLGLSAGDEFFITFRRYSGMLESTALQIAATISSGYADIDRNTVFLSLSKALAISGAIGPGELNITIRDPQTASKVKASLQKQLPDFRIQSWKDAGQAISALNESKEAGSGILVFFLGVIAIVGVVNTMLMSVLEKKKEIGTLKALGMPEKDIRRLFLLEGGLLGVLGASAGIALAALLNIYLSTVGIDFQAVIGEMGNAAGFKLLGPVRSTWNGMAFVTAFITSVVASAAASYFPARRAVKMEAAAALRTIQ